jgi:lipopolysaccharide transport system ATP-binding protein
VNLSKQYRIGERESYRALRDVLAGVLTAPTRWIRAWSEKETALSIPQNAGTVQGLNGSANGQYFWALKDVSFSVAVGEVIGIIGRNGAGKSTLLKILSRITRPTAGHAMVHGRVGSLLEVGTGFHPELTGRENVYLNGVILGMRRAEIGRKFDEIIAFAEVERFVDTQVKHYSSGMYTRLAFAVAAHLEPEILLVDEVLAVGDIAFQKKCLGRMGDIARGGRTVCFVSHQLNQIRRLCQRCIWIEDGQVRDVGQTHAVTSAYETAMSGGRGENHRPSHSPRIKARYLRWELLAPQSSQPHVLTAWETVRVQFTLRVYQPLRRASHGIALFDAERKLMWGTEATNLAFQPGCYALVYELATLPLRPGAYQWLLSLYDENGLVDFWDGLPEMLVATPPLSLSRDDWAGFLNLPYKMEIGRTEEREQ